MGMESFAGHVVKRLLAKMEISDFTKEV